MNISKTRTWLAVTALGALLPVEASMAADLPVKAQPIAAATFDWSGVYIGAHAGYGGGMKDWAFSQQADMPQADFIARGALAGGQIGINKQLGSFVFGMELAASWADIGGNSHVVTGAPPFSLTVNHASRIDGLATIAGRAGLAADRWFVFAKAGLSAVHEKHSVSAGVGASLTTSGNEVRYAPMLGFGSEYALTGNWSLFGEYGFHYLGERTVAMREATGLFGAGLAFDHHIDQSIHIVKAGVNYRWGGVAVDPSYAALRPAPGNNWTGGYIGAQGGYAWGQTTWPDAYLDTSAAPEFRTDGWLAGGTIGVNAQAGSFVFGVEGEILGTGIKGSETVRDTLKGVGTVTTSYDSTIDWLALATARAGFVVGSNLMLYGKGGVAIAQEAHTLHFSQSFPVAATTVLSGKAIHTGVVAGAGAEYAIATNWSVSAEYDYVRMFQQPVYLTGAVTAAPSGASLALARPENKIQQDLHLVKFGVNYHFNPLPAVIAKY